MDDLTWEFRLRKGVKSHDGSDFTAADVAFSLDRVPTVPNSPSPFTTYSKQITEKVIVDPHTIRLKTAKPYPLMPNDMGTILIVSSRAAKGASTDDFNTGKAGSAPDRSGSCAGRRATASSLHGMMPTGVPSPPGTK